MIKTNLKLIKNSIEEICHKGNINKEQVQLIAVSKNKSVEEIMVAYNEGQRVFGENRVQEIVSKQPKLPGDIDWHLIGHLQTNKVKYIIDTVALIHSLDSLRLAEEINKRAGRINRQIPVLVQVNIAEEDSKFGLKEGEVIPFLNNLKELTYLRVEGLMTIAPEMDDSEEVRPVFRKLKQLFEKVKTLDLPNVEMKHLSMGMSGDYQVAIEEGATLVRVGSSIFGDRVY